MVDDMTYTTRDIILRLKEGLNSFGDDHHHYNNESYKSSAELANVLFRVVGKNYLDIAPDKLPSYLVLKAAVGDKGCSIHYWKLNGRFDTTSDNKRKIFLFKGDYESRLYFSYHILQAVASKSFRPSRGLVCPSILFDVKATGELVDSGLRLMRIFMTRCDTHEIWGLIYNKETGAIVRSKDLFKDTGNQVAVNYVPFDLEAPNK